MELFRYALAPSISKHLGFSDSERPTKLLPVSAEAAQVLHHEFIEVVLPKLSTLSTDEIATIFEELVLMAMPSTALNLARACDAAVVKNDFRCCLALGSAAMLNELLEESEEWFRQAQILVPQEIAPYKNLCEIFYAQERDAECKEWARAALKVDCNSFGIWDILGACLAQTNRATVADELTKLANELGSWAGVSLACQYLAPTDALLRAQKLGDFYALGVRSREFLVEYTAALGTALQYDQIPSVLWEAENLHGRSGAVGWELYAHAAQAEFAQDRFETALKLVAKAKQFPDVGASTFEGLVQLEREIKNEMNESTQFVQ